MKRIFLLLVVLSCAAALISTEAHVASAGLPDQVTTSTMTFENFVTSPSPLQQVWNGPFTVLSTTGTNLPCELWGLNFTATTGQYLSGSFNSDIPVSFFVVQLASYQSWVKAGTCGTMVDAIAGELLTTSYIISPVAIPSSGTWTIVIVNGSNARDADGYLSAYLTTMPYTVTGPLTGTVTLTTSTTSTITAPTAVSGQPAPGQTVPGFPVSSIIVGIVAGLVAVVLKRRNHH